jgi:hypothetical protein
MARQEQKTNCFTITFYNRPENCRYTTLADVRTLIAKHLPAHFRDKRTWQHVAAELDKSATGGDPVEVSVALRLALSLEGVECGQR